MAALKYKDEKSLESIDEVLRFSNKVLVCDCVVINEENKIPPFIKATLGGALGAGIAGAAGIGAGATGIGMGAAASFAGAAIGGALLPITAPIAIFGGIGYLINKNKKKKELYNKKLTRYKEAIKKQNEIIKMYQEKDRERVETEEKLKKENIGLRAKINELLVVNEALLKIIEGLSNDLQAA